MKSFWWLILFLLMLSRQEIIDKVFNFSLGSVISKKNTNDNGKDSKIRTPMT